jgi:hypothetical protein
MYLFMVERSGRKPAVMLFFLIAAAGVATSGFFRRFEGKHPSLYILLAFFLLPRYLPLVSNLEIYS